MSISPAMDAVVENPFTSFVTGFTPWDHYYCSDLYSVVESPKSSPSSSDEPNQYHDDKPNSDDPDDTKPTTVLVIDERKRRRMLSNRESARRARMRKQNHLENLRNQMNRLRIENRGISNRLRLVLYSCHRLRTENDLLLSEQSMLQQKLWDIRRIILVSQQLQHQQYNHNMPACMAMQ